MAANVSVIQFRDMTGGLNLRANQFSLGQNESPDLMNVDVDPRGGFRLRNGVEPWGAADAGAAIHSLFPFKQTDGSVQLIAGWGVNVKYSTGGAWTTIKTDQTVSRPFSATQYAGNAYIQNGTDQVIKWTGSVASRLGTTASNDFDSPTTGNMRIGRCVAVFHDHVFVGNTFETATRFKSRVRWSHPGLPEAWRDDDYQDVQNGVKGDEIMGLASFGDQLVILKQGSIHVVMGYAWDSFQFDDVAFGVGACGPKAWCLTPGGVVAWSWPEGPILYDGKGIQNLGENLQPLIDEHIIDHSRLDKVVLGYIDGRVWCTVPVGSGTDCETYVFDGSVGRNGAWVRYDVCASDYAEYAPDAAGHASLFANLGTGLVLRPDTLGKPYDVFTISGDPVPIQAHYVTPWFDDGEIANKKRWRRPQVVFYVVGEGEVLVATYYNYDAADRRRSSHYSIASASGVATFDDPDTLWDGADDDDKWAFEGANHEVVRGSSLGTARSVQLRFEGPPTPVVWGVDAISLPFIPRKVR